MSEISHHSEPQAYNNVVEDRNLITPYAFSVNPSLLGTPLASPIRRGLAMLIDLFCVALMTLLNSLVLAVLVTVMFLRAGFRKGFNKQPSKLRKIMRALAGLMLFVLAFIVAESLNEEQFSDFATENLEVGVLGAAFLAKSLATTKDVELGECSMPAVCWQKTAEELVTGITTTDAISKQESDTLQSIIIEQAKEQLSEDELFRLKAGMQGLLDEHFLKLESEGASSEKPNAQSLQTTHTDEINVPSNSDNKFSLLNWVKGIAADLGLGFGWAAFYFTACTTWFQGRTVGKKLLGIKVIKLDASRINIWESFGRYGGYGAGLATGLLGFLQIFWDPNRQAIQDKISETLVINCRKPKQSGADANL